MVTGTIFEVDLSIKSMPPNGIALEGGGSKGAYQIGAWKAFMEEGIRFQAASGASIGAINGAFMAQGDFQRSNDFWQELSAGRHRLIDAKKARGFFFRFFTDIGLFLLPLPVGKLRMLHYAKLFALLLKTFSDKGAVPYLLRDGLLNVHLLEEILFSHLDLDLVLESQMDLYIFAYQAREVSSFRGGETSYVRAKEIDASALKAYLQASIAFPLLLPPVKIGDKNYRDGELEQPDIIFPLRERNLDRIYAIHLKSWKRRLFRYNSGDKIIHIVPSRDIGTLFRKTFDFSSQHIEKLIKIGYEDTIEMTRKSL